MSTRPVPTRWTYEEFARLPEDDGNRYEVIAGELYVTPSPRPAHQRVVTQLIVALETYVARHGLGRVYVGPIDVLFAEGDYVEPDLVFVQASRTGVISHRGIEAAPDLVVEVLSPTTAKRDRQLKRDRYLHFGVPEYWIVDADAGEVVVYRADLGAASPQVIRDRLVWRVSAETPPCEIDLAGLFASED